MNAKDIEQDELIRSNAERITRNEEALKRQTEALEQIRDHYYPPPEKWWRKMTSFVGKVLCVIVAYLGIVEAVDWIWNTRESQKLAEKYADVARELFYCEGDAVGAIACYEKALKLDPKESEYLMSITFMKGIAMVTQFLTNERPPTDAEQVQVDAALAEAFALNKLEPDNPMPYVLMAQAYLVSGEKKDAVEAVRRAVACAPKRANVRVSACTVLFAAGYPAEAREQLAEAERLDATLPLLSAWKGLLALLIDRDALAARRHFERTIRLVPHFPLGYQLLGRALLAAENPDLHEVRAAFSRALVLDAKLVFSMLCMAETYEREGDVVRARLWLDRALTADANYLPALVARARLLNGDADYAAAVADLTKAITLVPFRADLYRLRAEALEKAGDGLRAKRDRRTADALEKGERGS